MSAGAAAGAAGRTLLPASVLLMALELLVLAMPAAAGSGFRCRPGSRPVLFNFGDSNSDTGGMAAARGWHLTRPEGRAFFPRPTGRFCDGRLTIDFLCESTSTPPPPMRSYPIQSPNLHSGLESVQFFFRTSTLYLRLNPCLHFCDIVLVTGKVRTS